MNMSIFKKSFEKRASDIATREADKKWKENYGTVYHMDYEKIWLEIYNKVLKEFMSE